MVKINLVYVLAPFFVSSVVGTYIPEQYKRDSELVYARTPEDVNTILGRSDFDLDLDLERREPFFPLIAGALMKMFGKRELEDDEIFERDISDSDISDLERREPFLPLIASTLMRVFGRRELDDEDLSARDIADLADLESREPFFPLIAGALMKVFGKRELENGDVLARELTEYIE